MLSGQQFGHELFYSKYLWRIFYFICLDDFSSLPSWRQNSKTSTTQLNINKTCSSTTTPLNFENLTMFPSNIFPVNVDIVASAICDFYVH
jgi:hypothetical protein